MDEKKKQMLEVAITNENARLAMLEKKIKFKELYLSNMKKDFENKIQRREEELSKMKQSLESGQKYIKTIGKLINL